MIVAHQTRTTPLASPLWGNSARGVFETKTHVGLCAGEATAVAAPPSNDIVLEKRGITADTAVQWRLFGTTEQFWLNLQGAYVISRGKAEHSADSESYRPLKSGQARI